MKLISSLQRAKSGLSRWDEAALSWVDSHKNILVAIVTLLICVWSSMMHQAWMIPAIILIGGISYFLGIAVAVMTAFVVTGVSMFAAGHIEQAVTLAIVEVISFVNVAWLGHQHKAETILEYTRVQGLTHEDQVVPWAVVNDVRTSLAAIRFLLFPMHSDRNDSKLNQATDELSRLELLFSQMERKHRQIEREQRRYKDP